MDHSKKTAHNSPITLFKEKFEVLTWSYFYGICLFYRFRSIQLVHSDSILSLAQLLNIFQIIDKCTENKSCEIKRIYYHSIACSLYSCDHLPRSISNIMNRIHFLILHFYYFTVGINSSASQQVLGPNPRLVCIQYETGQMHQR